MSEHISVNGKNYLPSNELAARFKYTPDYIGKLAREEKVLGLQVGRVWYIEPVSLETHLHKIAVEKEIKNEELRVQRKKERLNHERLLGLKSDEVQKSHALVAVSEAIVVLLCGVFLGTLGFVGYTNHVSVPVLSAGIKDTSVFMVSAIIPRGLFTQNELLDTTVKLESQVAAVNRFEEGTEKAEPISQATDTESVVSENPRYTTLPLTAVTDADTAGSDGSGSVTLTFSDEVRVVTDARGVQYLEPVFREVPAGAARFSLTSETPLRQND